MVASVPYRSLSMVPGRPMIGMSNSRANSCAPVRDPFPPMTMRASMPASTMFSWAIFRPFGVMNSLLLAVLRMVPPRWMVLETEEEVNFRNSLSIRP